MAWIGSVTANRRRLISVATAVSLLALVASLTVSTAQAAPPAPLPPASAVLFGLDDHWENNIVTDDTQDSAVSGIVGTFLNWGTTKASSIVNYANWARSRQAVPMIDLHPPATATLASIAAGDQDAPLIADAKALHTWNHAFMFRLFPEMNGRWETYAPGREGQTAAQFIAAWRHVFLLFRKYGATKVMFVWNPDKEYRNQPEPLQAVWPGSNYVNWVGIDVFDREDKTHGTFANPVTAITPTVTDIGTFSHRPLMIAESGTVTSPVKATWIKQLFTGTASLGVKAVVYFNEMGSEANGSASWRLNSSSDALTATQQTLAGPGVAWPGHNNGNLFNDEHLILHATW